MESAWSTENPLACPIVATLNVMGGKWKPMILHMLTTGSLRFGEIKRNIPPVSQKVLTQQLRELESDGIICRKIYAEVPPRVDYSLTERGMALQPILDQLYQWSQSPAA